MNDAEFTDRETTHLKRELKKAKVHEVGRVVRRIRQLRNKKGTEAQIEKNNRKAARFEKELEFIKEAEVLDILIQITGSEDSEDEASSGAGFDLKKRALQRLRRSVPIQRFLERKNSGELESAPRRLGSNADTSNRSQGEPASPAPRPDAKGLASVFLASMSSTSAGSEQQRTNLVKKGKKNVKSKNTKEKAQAKNRMGQRARKKMWESMYGSQAKHVVQERTGNEFKSKAVEQKSKLKSTNVRNSADENLHPSWQATKKKKLEQSNVEFKGQKTKFDENSD